MPNKAARCGYIARPSRTYTCRIPADFRKFVDSFLRFFKVVVFLYNWINEIVVINFKFIYAWFFGMTLQILNIKLLIFNVP